MSDNSSIEWTDATWNPIRARLKEKIGAKAKGSIGWYCEHATTGCEFCYAEGMNKRLGTGLAFKPGHRGDVDIFLDQTMLTLPLRWKKPRTIFVCSMTDIFADFIEDHWLNQMFGVMALTPQHTYQILTKRPARMQSYLAGIAADYDEFSLFQWADASARLCQDGDGAFAQIMNAGWPLPNVWLGVSAERQQEADERIPFLLETPAAVRFISAEPLLGHIALHALNLATPTPSDALRGVRCVPDDNEDGYHNEPTAKLDWVIVGGESGPSARSMHPSWARELRDWCQSTGVSFFFKQWGEWAPSTPDQAKDNPRSGWRTTKAHPHVARAEELYPEEGAEFVERVGKKVAGRLLDGVEHNAMPKALGTMPAHG